MCIMINDFESICSYIEYNVTRIWCEELNTVIFYTNAESISTDGSFIWMPNDRRDRMQSFSFENDKKLLLGSELAFLCGLCYTHNMTVSCDNVREMCNNVRSIQLYGKPYIANGENVHFNMSHSGKYSVCAFSEASIGVDIECMNNDFMEIAEMLYSEKEYGDILNAPDEMKKSIFYEYWVMKESYIKANGMGMGIALNSFSFEQLPNGCWKIIQGSDQYILQRVNFADIEYKLAVCKKIC